MSTAAIAAAPPGARRTRWTRGGTWVARAWRRLGWRQVASAALIYVLLAVFGPSGGAYLFPGTRTSDPVVGFLIGRWVWSVLPLVFAAMVADEAYEDGVAPLMAYGAALLVGSFAAGFLDTVGGHLLGWSRPGSWAPNGFRIKLLLLQGSLCMAIYGYWRTTQRALRRVQAAEADRIRDRQQLLAARLLALQARVEPQFLFDALSRIGDLHERDPATADALLADLIALLRAMLPVGTAAMSTVEREFALAGAWLRVQRHLGKGFEIEIEASPLAGQSGIGAMIVLPLLQEIGATPRARAIVWRLSAAVAASDGAARVPRLHIRLEPLADGARPAGGADPTSPSIERLRERLLQLYGSAATLTVAELGDALPTFAVDLPLIQENSVDDHGPDR